LAGGQRPAELDNDSLAQLEKHAHQWVLTPAGTEGYEKAEVTAGGVDTERIVEQDNGDKKVRGLFYR